MDKKCDLLRTEYTNRPSSQCLFNWFTKHRQIQAPLGRESCIILSALNSVMLTNCVLCLIYISFVCWHACARACTHTYVLREKPFLSGVCVHAHEREICFCCVAHACVRETEMFSIQWRTFIWNTSAKYICVIKSHWMFFKNSPCQQCHAKEQK